MRKKRLTSKESKLRNNQENKSDKDTSLALKPSYLQYKQLKSIHALDFDLNKIKSWTKKVPKSSNIED